MSLFSIFTSNRGKENVRIGKMDYDDYDFEDAGTGTPLSAVTDAFEEISDLIKKDNSNGVSVELRLKPFCDVCSLVSVLFGCLGIAFKFAEMEYISKVTRESEKTKMVIT